MTNTTQLPRSYRTWTGLAVISALLGRRVQFLIPGQARNVRPVYPNMYIVLVGPASRGKGNTLTLAEMVLAPHAERIQFASSTASRKALFLELERANASQRSTLAIADELSQFLFGTGNNNTRGASGEVIADLCHIFDCKKWEWETQKEGKHVIREPYLTILAGATMTWLKTTFPPTGSGTGLVSRFMFAVEEGRAQSWRLCIDYGVLERLAQELAPIAQVGSGTVIPMTREALAYTDTWFAEDDVDPNGEIGSRYIIYGVKVAGCLAVAEDASVIEVAHMQRARGLVVAASPAHQNINLGDNPIVEEVRKYRLLIENGVALTEREIYHSLADRMQESQAVQVVRMLRKAGLLA